jgi:hypothetical protein
MGLLSALGSLVNFWSDMPSRDVQDGSFFDQAGGIAGQNPVLDHRQGKWRLQ